MAKNAKTTRQGSKRHIILTGASGYVGSHLLSRLVAADWDVTILGRQIPECAHVRFFAWNFGDPVPIEAFSANGIPATAFLHLAHHWNSTLPEDDDENLRVTDRLIKVARSAEVETIIFASSISARKGALNRYGRLKWQLEQLLQGDTEKAARIGLIYGGPYRGQWAQMVELTSLTPILPMISPNTKIQAIHLDELADGLISLAEGKAPEKPVVGLASNQAISFGQFLKALRRAKLDKALLILPVPISLALTVISIVRLIPYLPNVDKERVLGLAGLPTLDTESDLEDLDLKLAPVQQGLHKNSRRGLIREGLALLKFTLRRKPTIGETLCYVRGIERHNVYWPAVKPPFWRFTAIYDFSSSGDLGLRQRLHIAALISECSPNGGKSYYEYERASLTKSLAITVVQSTVEITLMPIRRLLAHFLK